MVSWGWWNNFSVLINSYKEGEKTKSLEVYLAMLDGWVKKITNKCVHMAHTHNICHKHSIANISSFPWTFVININKNNVLIFLSRAQCCKTWKKSNFKCVLAWVVWMITSKIKNQCFWRKKFFTSGTIRLKKFKKRWFQSLRQTEHCPAKIGRLLRRFSSLCRVWTI